MMNLFAVSVILISSLASFTEASSGAGEVAFGTLRFELHSKSSSEARVLLADLLARTTTFLDTQLQAYFSENISDDYFSHTGLGVVDFTVVQTDDLLYSATVDFEGSAFVTTVPVPGTSFIVELLKTAFQGSSRLEFVRDLKQSDTTFLADVTYLLVELNHKVIAIEDLANDGGDTTSTASGTDDVWTQNQAIIIAVSCAAVLVLALVALAYFYARRARTSKKPLRVKTTVSKQATDEDPDSPVQSPSPVHSICSQESSKFTYNPRSLYTSTSSLSALTMETKTIHSNFSTLNVDIENGIDMEAWTRQSTISPMTPAPFGNDLSAIDLNAKDLSLIMEGTDEENTPASSKSGRSLLTMAALQSLDNKLLNVDWNRSIDGGHHDDSLNTDEEEGYEVSDTSDVISDLKNLSLQIERHRGDARGPALYGKLDD